MKAPPISTAVASSLERLGDIETIFRRLPSCRVQGQIRSVKAGRLPLDNGGELTNWCSGLPLGKIANAEPFHVYPFESLTCLAAQRVDIVIEVVW